MSTYDDVARRIGLDLPIPSPVELGVHKVWPVTDEEGWGTFRVDQTVNPKVLLVVAYWHAKHAIGYRDWTAWLCSSLGLPPGTAPDDALGKGTWAKALAACWRRGKELESKHRQRQHELESILKIHLTSPGRVS